MSCVGCGNVCEDGGFCSDRCRANNACRQCDVNKKSTDFRTDTWSGYGARGARPVYFCSMECKEKFDLTICATCNGQNSLTPFNGRLYCGFDYCEVLHCYNYASGDYYCERCEETKNVSNTRCILIGCDDGDKVFCGDCVGNRIDEYLNAGRSDGQWCRTSGCDYDAVIRLLKQLMCERCRQKKCVDELEIVDDENVCVECRQ